MAPTSAIGTPLTPRATRALLLGSGELGKEVAIELQRLGIETIAVDRYPDAPAMQVAHRAHVVDMRDGAALRSLLEREQPSIVIPEIEAIATEVLVEIEREQPWPVRVAPTASAARTTMDREGIRRLAAEHLELPTSSYRFVSSETELDQAARDLGLPVVVKPVMSSSGKGQSVVRFASDVPQAWRQARTGARGRADGTVPMRCIVEGFVDFDYEITLLTVRHRDGTLFLDPIRHVQIDGDYAESWQGEPLPSPVLREAQRVAGTITEALGGWGVFGVELFVQGDRVIFSEVSPRPHDTGLVTLVSQDASEFALHARAVLGLPIPGVERFPGAAASVPIKVHGHGVPVFEGIDDAMAAEPSVQIRLFGKPRVDGERRVAVALARGRSVEDARAAAHAAAASVRVRLE